MCGCTLFGNVFEQMGLKQEARNLSGDCEKPVQKADKSGTIKDMYREDFFEDFSLMQHVGI